MSNQLVQKLWNYCNILRDDGLSYGDYVEQLTFLLFLKMADEQAKPPFNKPSPIPKGTRTAVMKRHRRFVQVVAPASRPGLSWLPPIIQQRCQA